ncbi:MAG: hypothetical protein ACLQJR_10385 [Stellaceae bacterium]
MPRHDPTIAATDETAFGNIETILLEHHGDRGPEMFSFGTADFDRAMLMAHIFHRLVRRHSLKRRIGGTST